MSPVLTREEVRHRLARWHAPAPRARARCPATRALAPSGPAPSRRPPRCWSGWSTGRRPRAPAHPAHRASARPCRPDLLPGRADRTADDERRRRGAARGRGGDRPRSGAGRGHRRAAAVPDRHRVPHPSRGRLDQPAVRAAARSVRGRRSVRGAAALRARPGEPPAPELPARTDHAAYYVLPYQGRFIWGATAGILVNLARVLRA